MNDALTELFKQEALLTIKLLEIIDALIFELEGRKQDAVAAMKQCLIRLRLIYQNSFKLRGSGMRIRSKALMMIGFMCSSLSTFPKTEKLWRFLHEYRVTYNTEYLAVFPHSPELYAQYEECKREVDDAIVNHPIEQCDDYQHLVQAFEMLRNWAHHIMTFKPEHLHDSDWRKVNPWVLNRSGESLLIDYWWDVPQQLRGKGNYVLNMLASSNIKSVDDVKKLRQEIAGNYDCYSLVKHYFNTPYVDMVHIYNNVLRLQDIPSSSFTELLSHKRAGGKSIALSIHEAIVTFIGTVKDKRVLDVGCKIGYFSFLMAEAGAQVTGIEYMDLPSKVATCIAKTRNLSDRCTFITMLVHNYLNSVPDTFDLTLMLNVFDHVLSNQKIAWKVLDQISSRSQTLALMMGPTIPAPNQEDIPQLILSHSSFTHYKTLLTNSYGKRTLYGFYHDLIIP